MEKVIDFFDHDADIGIIGRGDTVEEAFCRAAQAVFQIMSDLSVISPNKKIKISFEESDTELALVIWLNHLIAKARELHMLFSSFELERNGHNWIGYACGDTWQKHFTHGTEVKGATLTMLNVSHNGKWEARCVVDV